ncbi:MAG: YegS/Rv2252/BmrU family lipid kinase [Elainellaceae cyanobacterium]
MIQSAYLIFNPVAGQGNPEQDLSIICSALEPEIDLTVHETTEEITADQLAREALEAGAEAILVSGGDGTISSAANALIGTDTPLGIISRGTANAFANALGLPEGIEQACQTILQGKTKRIDVATCNDKPMVLLAGIGFEAKAIEKADRTLKNRLGRLAYVFSSFRELRNIEKFKATIETDDKTIELDATAITVANAAPPTSILAQGPAGILADDGYLDLTVMTTEGFTNALSAGFRLLRSAMNDDAVEDRDDIGFMRSRRIKVTAEPEQKVVLDGEIVGHTPVEITCVPMGLTLFASDELAPQADETIEQMPNVRVVEGETSLPQVPPRSQDAIP